MTQRAQHEKAPKSEAGEAEPTSKVRDQPRAIYKAKDWHVDDGVASDGTGRKLRHSGVRRVFTAEYKLAFLAEYDGCTEPGQKGALLRREGLYGSMVGDWKRQHRQGLLRAAVGRNDGGRGGPTLPEMNKLRNENQRLRVKLAQAEAIIEVQGKVHALLEEISKGAIYEG